MVEEGKFYYPKVSFWLCVDKNDYFASTNNVPWSSKLGKDVFRMMWNKQLIVCGHNSSRYFTDLLSIRYYTPWILSRTGRNINIVNWIDSVVDAVAFAKSNDQCLKNKNEFVNHTEIVVIGGYKTFRSFLPLVDSIYVLRSGQFSSGYVHLLDVVFPELARHFVVEADCPLDLETDVQLYKRKRFVSPNEYTLYSSVESSWKYEVQNRQLSADLLRMIRLDDGYKSN